MSATKEEPRQEAPAGPLPLEMQYASVADIPAIMDSAGFKPYVEAIATFLSDPKTNAPFTLAIEGEWGSGKSSFMLQLKEALKERGAKKFVQFNAWRFDKDEALWASFALEFARQVAPPHVLPRISRRMALAVRRLLSGRGWLGLAKVITPLMLLAFASWIRPDNLKQWDSLVQSIAAVVLAPLSIPLMQQAWKFLGNPFSVDLKDFEEAPSYESRIPFLQQFHEDFQLLCDTYLAKSERVFIFIDDLDRCEVPRSCELLQAINLMIGDSTKAIFVLGIDREKVAAGIALRHEKLLPLIAPAPASSPWKTPYDPEKALEFGHDFLERFIQLPFRVPRLSDRLDPMLDLLLGATPDVRSLLGAAEAPRPEDLRRRALVIQQADVDSVEIREAMKMVSPVFGANPRRLKKFLNVLRVSIYIASETGLFDIHPGEQPLTIPQLAKFVALSLRWPRLLDDLEAHPELLSELLKGGDPVSELARTWAQRRQLVPLLRFLESNPSFSLRELNITRLRSVAPALTARLEPRK